MIDARGLRCPLPVIRLAAAAKKSPPGTELVVLSTDPAALPDIAAWCRMRGHELVIQEPFAGGALRHVIRLA
jgi:tRNA 2-thiouridine synthesizing protein A